MRYKLVDRKEYADLLEEVKELRKLVDSLCVSTGEMPKDDPDRKVWFSARSAASIRGYRLMRTLVAQHMLRELDEQKQTILEDFPGVVR